MKRSPRNLSTWWSRNGGRFRFLGERGFVWVEASTDSVGSFEVRNISRKGEIGGLRGVLTTVEGLIRRSPLVDFDKVLYGTVVYTDKVLKGASAFYSIARDAIYVEARGDVRLMEHAIIHELAHRYWYKFGTSSKRAEWDTYYTQSMQGVSEGAPLPRNLWGRVSGSGEYTIIWQVSRYGVVLKLDSRIEGDVLDNPDNYRTMRHREFRTLSVFPTAYAQTNAEEHFAEALAFLTMGNLSEQAAEDFMDIWV